MLRARAGKAGGARAVSPEHGGGQAQPASFQAKLFLPLCFIVISGAVWVSFSNLAQRSSGGGVQGHWRRRLTNEACHCPLPTGRLKVEQSPPQITALENVTVDCDTLAACQSPLQKCGVVVACGLRVYCGGCVFPSSCGGDGRVPNKCGCKPRTCQELQRSCGQAPDGCGSVLTCGEPCQQWALDPKTPQPPPPPMHPYRIGYFDSSAQYRDGPQKFEAEDIEGQWFSHIIFSAVVIDNDTDVVKRVNWNDNDINGDFILKGKWRMFYDACELAGAVPMVALGGTAFLKENGGKEIFSRVVADALKRRKLVDSVLAWLEKYKFEGVEVHWIPESPADALGMMTLLTELNDGFAKLSRKPRKKYWLSVRASANTTAADIAYPNKVQLVKLVDWVAVMTEEMHVWKSDQSEKTTRAHTPIHDGPGSLSIGSVVAHWRSNGVPSHSIIMAISTNAVIWRLKQEASTSGYGAEADGCDGLYGGPTLPYAALAAELDKYMSRDIIHAPTSSAYAVKGKKWASYDSPDTVALKVDFIVQQDLGGYIISIDTDSKHSLSKAASDRLMPSYPKMPIRGGKVLLVTSAYNKPCTDPQGMLFVLLSLKNKLEYAHRHGLEFLHNQGSWNGEMSQMWAKEHILRNAMIERPDVEWFMWMDIDAVFTDQAFQIPLEKYRGFNLVVPGYRKSLYIDALAHDNKPMWTCINAGIFLLRNCDWSLHLLNEWLVFSDPEKAVEYGHFFNTVQRGRGADQPSNDQSALIHLLFSEPEKFGDKTFFEQSYALHGFWEPLVTEYEQWAERGGPQLKWPEGPKNYENRPPFVTHFVGCKICGGLGSTFKKDLCFAGLHRALNFADSQFILKYNLTHVNYNSADLIHL